MKLLCRMYEPTEGSLSVGGVPLDRLDRTAWLSQVTAAFQDFTRFELLARESVGIGDVGWISDAPSVNLTLERADAVDMIRELPRGLDTQLGGSWEDGHEPSIDQWQKLAIARYAMPDRPALYILDEPTASLDPQTEHHVFERQRAIAEHAASDSITILVSHRFSTVSLADLIVVLEGGRVVETGSHEQLMRTNACYARFYRLQRDAYRMQMRRSRLFGARPEDMVCCVLDRAWNEMAFLGHLEDQYMTVTERIMEHVRTLPDAAQAEILDFVEYLKLEVKRAESEGTGWSGFSFSQAMRGMESEASPYSLDDAKEELL